MANSHFSVPYNDSIMQGDVDITIGFLDPSHLEVRAGGVLQVAQSISVTGDYVIDTTESKVRFHAPHPADGLEILIQRTTPSNAPLTDWPNQTNISGQGLDVAATQPLYVVEEYKDVSDLTHASEAASRISGDAANAADIATNTTDLAAREPLLRQPGVPRFSPFGGAPNDAGTNGDIIWNQVAFAGSPVGWVCYSAGVAGVALWRSFGSGS